MYGNAPRQTHGEQMCYRKPGIARHMTPGLFTVCCEHGICHGFMLLLKPESEAQAFDVFFNRMRLGMARPSA